MAAGSGPGRFTFDAANNLQVTGGGGGGGDVNITEILGSPVSFANALPVELSDGTNPLGVTGNPILVAGAQPSGDLASTNPVQIAGQDGSGFVQPIHTRFDGTLVAAIVDTNGNSLVSSSSALLVQPQMPGPNTVDAGNGTTTLGTQRVTISSDSTGQIKLAAGAAVIGHVVTDTGSTTAVTGNVTVIQPTGTNLHAIVDSGSITAVQATGSNLHVVTDTGSTTAVTGTVTVSGSVSATQSGTWAIVGTLTNNGAAPSTTNFGVLPALANAAAPSWTEGRQVLLSVDLAGNLRIVNTTAQASTTSGQTGALVMGAVTTSKPTYTTAQTNPISIDTGGQLRVVFDTTSISQICTGASVDAGASMQLTNFSTTGGGNRVGAVGIVGYTGISSAANAITRRTPNIFKTALAASSGDNAVWTPTTGKKFRLMRFKLQLSADATIAAAGRITVTFRDNTTATNLTHVYFLGQTALTGATVLYTAGQDSGWIDLENGILSAAANNVLNINLSAALATGTLSVLCCGTEE